MSEKPASVNVSGRTTPDTKRKLNEIAEADDKTQSEMMREMLNEGIERRLEDTEPTKLEKAAADIKAVAWQSVVFIAAVLLLSAVFELVGLLTDATAATAYRIAFVTIPAGILIWSLALALLVTGALRPVGDALERLQSRLSPTETRTGEA